MIPANSLHRTNATGCTSVSTLYVIIFPPQVDGLDAHARVTYILVLE